LKKPRPQLVIDISDVSYYDIDMEDFLAMIKACIFDLDGTIGNTLDSMVYSVNLTLKEMNLSEISKEQCREFVWCEGVDGEGTGCIGESWCDQN
jgi:hypothetical protein